MRSKCNSIQRLLSDYVDGILSDEQVKKIDQHLVSCSKCRAFLSSLEKTNRILDFYTEQEPPEGYFDEVWTQIESEISSRKKSSVALLLRKTSTSAPSIRLSSTPPFSKEYNEYGISWNTWKAFPCSLWNSLYSAIGLKFRILQNKLYDEFVWWTDRVSWSKLLWQSMVVILLVFSAITIDRTYFRPSIDKTLLQKITQSLSEGGFYIVEYTPSSTQDVYRKPRTHNGMSPFCFTKPRLTHPFLMNDQQQTTKDQQSSCRSFPSENPDFPALSQFVVRPLSAYSPHNLTPSVIKSENGFLTFVGNVEVFDFEETDNTREDQFNFVSLYSPKDITQVKITYIKEIQSQIDSVNIQDIYQSFRRKSNNESPFKVFLTDVSTSELSVENFN